MANHDLSKSCLLALQIKLANGWQNKSCLDHKEITYSPTSVDSSKGPKRVNRAHWPTKENWQNSNISKFFRPMEKMASDGPKWGQEAFFLLIQTLPTFGAEGIWILRVCFLIFWIPNFCIPRSPDLQIPRFPGSQISKRWAMTAVQNPYWPQFKW